LMTGFWRRGDIDFCLVAHRLSSNNSALPTSRPGYRVSKYISCVARPLASQLSLNTHVPQLRILQDPKKELHVSNSGTYPVPVYKVSQNPSRRTPQPCLCTSPHQILGASETLLSAPTILAEVLTALNQSNKTIIIF